MKLINKLIIMAALIGIPLVITSVQFIGATRRSLEFKIREVHRKTAETLAERIQYFFTNHEKYCSTFIYNTELTAGDDAYFEMLKTMMAQFNEFRIISITDGEGRLIMSLSSLEIVPPSEMARHISLIPAKSVIEEKRIIRSVSYKSPVDGSTLMTIAFPFPQSEMVLGVEIELDELEQLVKSTTVGRTGIAYIVDEKGMVIAHQDDAKMFKDISYMEIVGASSGGNVSGVKNFVDEDGELMTGAYYILKNGWRVIVQEPRDDAYYSADRMKNLAVIAIMLSVLFAVATAFYITRSLVDPMNKLVHGAQEISMGNLEHAVDVSGGGEMGFLAGAFNSMSNSLSKREKAISGINQAAKRISTIIDRETLSDTAIDILITVSGCSLISVIVSDDMEQHHTRVLSGEEYKPSELPEIMKDKLQIVLAGGITLVENSIPWHDGTEKSLCFLLLEYEDDIVGAIALADDNPKRIFTNTDLQIFGIIASSMAISLKNIQLLEEAIEKTRLEEEIKTAELVQRTFFPESPPDIPGLDLSSFIESASETGGDYFGFVHDPQNSRVAVLIADVTGHGVPAAMVTATTYSFFQTLEIFRDYLVNNISMIMAENDGIAEGGDVLFDHLSPEFMLKCLNEIILRSTRKRLEMTVFASVYYYDTKRLVYANAGHNQPLIFRPDGFAARGRKKKQNTVRYLVSSGRRLGEVENPTFEEYSIELQDGDTMLWYTDGVIENENRSGAQFGEMRLERLFSDLGENEVGDIKQSLVDELKAFSEDTPLRDDITFIVGKIGEAVDLKVEEPAFVRPIVPGAPDNALIVCSDASLKKQLEWFLTGFGSSVQSFSDVEEALREANLEALDFCLVPVGGAIEQVLLASEIMKTSPSAKLVFLTSVPFDHLFSLFIELNLPLQLVLEESDNRIRIIRTVIAKYFSAPVPGLRHHLGATTPIHTIRIRDSYTRMEEAEELFKFAESVGIRGYSLDKLKFVADELVMNAFYDAPVDEDGDFRYADMSRSTPVKLPEKETPVIEFGSDGVFLGIAVRDPFGSLDEQEVLTRLEKHLFVENKVVSNERGGAGLGLYQVFKSVDQLVFNVAPGKMTEIICLIKLSPSVKYIEREIESIGFFRTGGDIDNGDKNNG